MPVQECIKNGKHGYKWGKEGFCYADGAKEENRKRALEQGAAIEAEKSKKK